MNKSDENKIDPSKTDALDKCLSRYAVMTESPTKKYWRWPTWETLARMSEGENGSSSDTGGKDMTKTVGLQ